MAVGKPNLNSSLFEIVANPCAVGAVEGEGELTISARSGMVDDGP